MDKWTSLHVFYHNVPKYDEMILGFTELLADMKKEKKIEKWFFIRYWEGGPHIRIRLLNAGESEIAELKALLYDFMEKNPPDRIVTREEYYKDNKFDGVPLDEASLPWYENGEIAEIDYEPEIERYGGENVMELSENIFDLSSNMTRGMIASSGGDFNKKLILAEALTLIEVRQLRKVYGRSNTADYLELYRTHWSSFLYGSENEKMIEKFFSANTGPLKKAYKILTDNEEFMSVIGKICDNIAAISAELDNKDRVDYIVSSHIHMTNNRLGAAPVFEYFISDNLKQKESEVK